jgi:hypothetical protein
MPIKSHYVVVLLGLVCVTGLARRRAAEADSACESSRSKDQAAEPGLAVVGQVGIDEMQP